MCRMPPDILQMGICFMTFRNMLASQAIRMFAMERRRVVSRWRVLIATRRIARSQNARLPGFRQSDAVLKELRERGDLSAVKGVRRVFMVDTLYANLLEASEEQFIQEANPWAVFGFQTAMIYHGITDLPRRALYTIRFKDGQHVARTPFGTTPEDWVDVEAPPPVTPTKAREVDVIWTNMHGRWDFGVMVGSSSGMPIYLTDLERTLLDALRMPEKCGGIVPVLHAWRAADGMDVDRLVAYTDRYGMDNLRQRVGFFLGRLGREHNRVAAWRDRAQRYCAVKLFASGHPTGNFSGEWNLSLNVPPSVLAILEKGAGLRRASG
jgi:hypothetical protein